MCTYAENVYSDRADAESHIVEVRKSKNSQGEEQGSQIFSLPSDAHRDSVMLDWILARKEASEETLDDFNDLMN